MRRSTTSRATAHSFASISIAATFLTAVGAAATVLALVVIWGLRLLGGHDVYVSGLGAEGMPTAPAFNLFLGVLGGGGLAIALGGLVRVYLEPRLRATSGVRGVAETLAWPTLALASACFVLASVTPCSTGCPVPGSASFTTADALHLSAAITGFVLVCVAMLLVVCTTLSLRERGVAAFSLAGVSGTSASGGLLALAGAGAGVGALLEFAAMTLGVLWAAVHAATRRSTNGNLTQRISRLAPERGRARRSRGSAGSTVELRAVELQAVELTKS
ncbi:MAG: hypothetical protein WDA07_03245 [Leucobacter sp.]